MMKDEKDYKRKRPTITTHAQLSQSTQQLIMGTKKLKILMYFFIPERPTITTHAQLSQSTQQLIMGTKRGRFLMRQPRIKRESDPSQHGEGEPLSPQFLTVPHVRVERQCSDPLPTISPPPGNLLSVPGNILVKQHSHPLLPSQTHQHQSSTPPIPLHVLLPQTHCNEGDRSISPVVVVSDPLAMSPHDTHSRTERGPPETTATLRVRTDELRRSSSSPQIIR
ncbi:hypothetical protein QE152_g38797 [Popillia japonica]|uniref:Uncharacterized protein n=1 Tax=Popillia japonica TaxID=7064 RepID=A0AAW1HVD2_POPJA